MLYIFDMGGVVTNTASVIEQIGHILNITDAEFMKYCGCGAGNAAYGVSASNAAYNPYTFDLLSMCSDGIITSKQFWHLFSERSGRSVQTDWWHWLFHPVRNPKTEALVGRLRQAGNRVVCGTNTIDSHYANHCERGDYAIFDQTYASCLMGVSKPNPEFWNIILTAENVSAPDAVFIDDKAVNCKAASSLGIRAIQFFSAEQVAAELGVSI